MITAVAVSGYRSLRSLVLPLTGFDVITGPNGSGKSTVARALRLLASAADGGIVPALAREGGLASALWAGKRDRGAPVALMLGFASDSLGYLVDLGLPVPGETLFVRDPQLKRELVFAGPLARGSAVLVERTNATVRVRDDGWRVLEPGIGPFESILSEAPGAESAPEILGIRREVRSWRCYGAFRADRDAPARMPQVGTRTPVLDEEGRSLAAALQTIIEAGDGARLDRLVATAFPGSRVRVRADDGVFAIEFSRAGLVRPLGAAELSDGTLRFLLLTAALLSPDPPGMLVLDEPESSLHPDLFPALAALVVAARERTQVVVVSHAAAFVAELERAGANRIGLVTVEGATVIEGFGLLDGPPWDWRSR